VIGQIRCDGADVSLSYVTGQRDAGSIGGATGAPLMVIDMIVTMQSKPKIVSEEAYIAHDIGR